MATVSIAKAENRYETVHKALEIVKDEIENSLRGKNKVIIKPNFVSISRQLAATHVDAVRAIINFLQKFKLKKIIIAEAAPTFLWGTAKGYKNFGYLRLKDEYGVELIDLNEDDYEKITIFDRNFNEIEVRVSRTLLNSEYTVSSAMLKTHDVAIVTMSLKNMAVGSIIGGDKPKIHRGYQAINLNIYRILRKIPVHLAVIDGWEGMEGNGPVHGERVETRIALAGVDAVAVDTVGATVMGINPTEIGYLQYCNGRIGEGNINKIKIVGENLNRVRRGFKLHYDYSLQRNWQIPAEKLEKLLSQS